MAKKNQNPTPARNIDDPQPQRDDLGQTGQERERNRGDQRSGIDEDDSSRIAGRGRRSLGGAAVPPSTL